MNIEIITKEDIQVLQKCLERIEENQLKITSSQLDQITFTDAEIQKILKCSASTTKRWREAGLLSYFQLGSKILYTRHDIQEFLDRNKIIARL